MSKILVDRELLERVLEYIQNHGTDQISGVERLEPEEVEIRAILAAQPAEAEGVSNARLMNTLAELARRAPLRTLQTICETQHQVSTVKLERYLEPVGDTLAGYAFTLRIDFDRLSAALSAVTAERDRLRKDAERYRWASSGVHEAETLVSIVNCHGGYAEKVAERVDVYREAAMAAKEA